MPTISLTPQQASAFTDQSQQAVSPQSNFIPINPQQASSFVEPDPIKRQDPSVFTGDAYKTYDPTQDPDTLPTPQDNRSFIQTGTPIDDVVNGVIKTIFPTADTVKNRLINTANADAPMGKGTPMKQGIDKTNEALYQSTGAPVKLGPIDTGLRTQQVTTPGEKPTWINGSKSTPDTKSTYLVPPPNSDVNRDKPMVSAFGIPLAPSSDSLSRDVVGAGLSAVKETAGAAEYIQDAGLLKPFTNALKLAHIIAPDSVTPDQVNWAAENIPTIAAKTDVDKSTQEIMSVVMGAATGAGEMKALTALPQAEQIIAKIATAFTKQGKTAEQIANNTLKAQTWVRAALTEYLGGNVGATVTSPSDAQSWTGGAFKQTGMDEASSNKMGTFLDNTLVTGLLGGVFKGFGAVAKQGQKVFNPNAKSLGTDQKIVTFILQQVDPSLKDVHPDEFVKRAGDFANALNLSSKRDFGELGNITMDPATSMVKGAMQYAQNAYGYLKNTMAPDAYQNFLTKKAQEVSNNLISLRRDWLSSTTVQAADAQMMEKGSTVLKGAADKFGNADTTLAAGQTLGNTHAVPLNQLQTDVTKANADSLSADSGVTALTQSDKILEDAFNKHAGIGGIPNAADDEKTLGTLAGKVTDNAVSAKNAENAAYKALPDIPKFDAKSISKDINVAGNGDENAFLDKFNVAEQTDSAFNEDPKWGPAQAAKGIKSPITIRALTLGQVGFKDIFTRFRPWLVSEIGKLDGPLASPAERELKAKYVALKENIDNQAKKYGGPDYIKALDNSKQFQETYMGTPETKQIIPEAIAGARNGFKSLSNPAREKMAQYMHGLLYNPTGDITKTATENLQKMLGDDALSADTANLVLNDASRNIAAAADDAGQLTPDALAKAVSPYAGRLKTLAPQAWDNYEKTMAAMRVAKTGSQDAKNELARMTDKFNAAKADAEQQATFKFVTQEGKNFGVVDTAGDAQATMSKIFRSPSQTKNMMNAAKATNDPEVLNGIRTQYIRDLKNRLLTSRTLSATGEGDFTQEGSLSALKKFFSDSNKSEQETLDAVLGGDADHPHLKEDVNNLLEAMGESLGARSSRAQTYSANTAVDTDRKKVMNLLITQFFGSLNPVATRLRSASGRVNDLLKQNEQSFVDKVLPVLLTDTDSFTSVIDGLVKDHSAMSIKKAVAKIKGLTGTAIVKGLPETSKGTVDPNQDTEQALGKVMKR